MLIHAHFLSFLVDMNPKSGGISTKPQKAQQRKNKDKKFKVLNWVFSQTTQVV